MKREKDSAGEIKHPTPFEKSRMEQEDMVDNFRKCGKKNPDHSKKYGRKKFTKERLTPKEAAQCIGCSMEWLGRISSIGGRSRISRVRSLNARSSSLSRESNSLPSRSVKS